VALAVLCAAQFLVVLDITVVNVALPAIREDLAIAPGRLHWAITAYAVAFGGLLLVAGRLADLVGRRRVFLAGVAVFGGFSLAAAATPARVVHPRGRAAPRRRLPPLLRPRGGGGRTHASALRGATRGRSA
jgi:MFS family permease